MPVEEMIELLQAFQRGEQLEWKYKEANIWHPVRNPIWDFNHQEFRIKPKPLEMWINIYNDKMIYKHETKQEAIDNAGSGCRRIAVHMKEVE